MFGRREVLSDVSPGWYAGVLFCKDCKRLCSGFSHPSPECNIKPSLEEKQDDIEDVSLHFRAPQHLAQVMSVQRCPRVHRLSLVRLTLKAMWRSHVLGRQLCRSERCPRKQQTKGLQALCLFRTYGLACNTDHSFVAGDIVKLHGVPTSSFHVLGLCR